MDLIRLIPYHRKLAVRTLVTLPNFMQIIEHRVAYSARNFEIGNILQNKLRDVWLLSNVTFLIWQEILLIHSF